MDEQREDSEYAGLFARHEPQNFTGDDARRIEEFFASPPPPRVQIPDGVLRWAPGTLGG